MPLGVQASTKSRAALALAVSLWLANGGVASAEEVAVDSDKEISDNQSTTAYNLTNENGVTFTVKNGGNVKAVFSRKSGNTITVKSGGMVSGYAEIVPSYYAGIAGGVSDNNVTIESEATVEYRVLGGYSAGGEVTGNTVTVRGTVNHYVFGGYTGSSGSASGNHVIVDGGTVKNGIYGGFAGTGTATGNTVELHNATVTNGMVYGGGGNGEITEGNTLILSGVNTVQSGVLHFETIKFNPEKLTWDTTKPVLKAWTIDDCGKLDVSAVTDQAIANGTMTLLQTTANNNLANRLKIGDTVIGTTGVKVKDEAKSSAASGVTLDYNLTHTVKLANADGMTNNAITYNVANVMNSISFGEMTWNTGRTLTAGDYDFANVTNANIDTANLKFTSPEDVTGSMTLLTGATGLAAGDNIAHSQDFTKTVNGATLSATLNGNVTRTTGEIGYTATGKTLNSVNLAGWNGTTSEVPTGWTAKTGGVAVTAAGFTEPSLNAGQSIDIFTTDTANFFGTVSGAKAYTSAAFTDDGAKGVTLSGNHFGGVKKSDDGKKLTYFAETMDVTGISLGTMTWGEGRTAATGYDFRNVPNENINTANLKFTDPEAATGSMTLLAGATNLATGTNIAHTQNFTKDVNGATLSATLSGNVIRTTAGEIGYEATGKALTGVSLANWNGTAGSVPTGWTAKAAGVAVTADDTFAPSIEAGASRDILTAAAGYFANANIGAAIAYQAYDFTNDEAQGVTHSGAQSKGVKTNEDKSALVYAVGKMDVKDISLGAMTWDTGRTATTDYDFANVAAIDANGLSFTFIDTQKAALSATSNMTLLDHATNLAAGKTVTGANRTQTIDYNASNGAALSGTLTGEVSTTAGAVNYQATGMTLDSVNLAGWDGTASAVPTGWTKNASGVAVTAADFTAPTIDAGTSKDILTTNTENFFSDEKITGAMKYAASAASSDTENGVTLTGSESKGVKAADDGKNLVYARSNFTVSNISLGEMTWGTARDASGTGYNYANAAVDLSGFTFANPEAIAAGNTTLLQANDTLAAIAEAEKNIAYQYSPVAGVTLDGQIFGSYKTTDAHAIQYTATENKANKLIFGDVEWKDSGALLDHATTLSHVSFNGADVDTANINFTNIESLEANKKMTLVSSFGDTVGTITGTKYKVGSTLEGEGKASLSGNDLIFTAETGTPKPAPTPTPDEKEESGGLHVQEQTHNTVMGAMAGMAALSAGNDFVGAATEGLALASNVGADGVSSFAKMGGGAMRQETGSHINVNTWNAILALGTANEKERGTFEYGAFFEYGSGNYTTHNGNERGDGSAHYTGGGLLAKWTAKHGFYVEGSLRAGTVHDDARNVLRDAFGNPYSYETNANYFGGHIGVGKEITLNNGNVVDVYGKYFVNRRNGVSFDAGGRYDLDPVTSQIVRIGARYTIKGKKWSFYAGAAYEHEMDGKATGKADGFAIRGADTSGGSFRGELGATVTPDKNVPVALDFNLTGFAGKKQGLSGGVSVALMF